MLFLALHVVFSFLVDLLHVVTRSEHDATLELLLLRQQLRLYERPAKQPRPSRWEKVALASLAARLPDRSRVALVFTPATLLRWHREIVKRAWTFGNRPKGGRPPVSAACVELIVRLARENRRWGYGKIEGELLKLGHRVSRSAIKRILRGHRCPQHPSGAAAPGAHSWASTGSTSWPATSSPSTRSSCSGCMCSASSSSAPDASTSPGVPRTPTWPG